MDIVNDLTGWLSSGAHVTSPFFIGICSAFLRWGAIPAIKWLSNKSNKSINGTETLFIVCILTNLIIYGIIYLTKDQVATLNILSMSVLISTSAIGIHSSGKTIQTDIKNFNSSEVNDDTTASSNPSV